MYMRAAYVVGATRRVAITTSTPIGTVGMPVTPVTRLLHVCYALITPISSTVTPVTPIFLNFYEIEKELTQERAKSFNKHASQASQA